MHNLNISNTDLLVLPKQIDISPLPSPELHGEQPKIHGPKHVMDDKKDKVRCSLDERVLDLTLETDPSRCPNTVL